PRRGGGKNCAVLFPPPHSPSPSRLNLLSHLHGIEQERRVLIPKRHHVKLKRLPKPALQVAHVVDRLLPDVIGCDLLGQLSFGGLDGSRLVDGPGDGVTKLAGEDAVLVVSEEAIHDLGDLRFVGGVERLSTFTDAEGEYRAVTSGEIVVGGEV